MGHGASVDMLGKLDDNHHLGVYKEKLQSMESELEQAVAKGEAALAQVLKDHCGVQDEQHQKELMTMMGVCTTYTPQPKDTSGVELPEEMKQLTELLSENAHEEWAQQRISQGWTFGPARDDASKKHPCLVPYSALSDEEKEYDRITAMNTIKLLLALGYTIVPPKEAE